MEIKKLKQRKDGIKFILIPKDSELKEGDWVMIRKIEEKEVEEWQIKKKK